MMKYAGVYIAVFLTMFIIDMVWLRVIAVSWYQEGMGEHLAASPNLVAAVLFYVIFPAGLMIFALLPVESASVMKVAVLGALFGFFAYATYDLTAMAVLKNWPVGLSILDMAWGTFVSSVATVPGKLALDYFNR